MSCEISSNKNYIPKLYSTHTYFNMYTNILNINLLLHITIIYLKIPETDFKKYI